MSIILKRGYLHSFRAVARPIIGGGGGVVAYSYIRVLPDGFLLKAIVFTVCEHEYTHPQLSSSYGPGYLCSILCFCFLE
jgi:hypothetical protein